MKISDYNKSREDYIDTFVQQYEARIMNCYNEEWVRYVDMCRNFMNNSIISKCKLRPLLVDHVETVPKDLENKLTLAEKKEFSIWLFKSSLVYLNGKAKVGDTVTNDLPVEFRCYLNPSRAKRLKDESLPLEFRIKDYNTMIELCKKQLEPECKKLGFKVNVEGKYFQDKDKFEYFSVYLILIRKYNKSEDILLKGKPAQAIESYNRNLTNAYNNFVNSRKDNNFFDRSQESYLAIILGTLGAAFVFTILAKILKQTNDNNFKKFMTQYVTIEEINALNEFFVMFKKDNIALGEAFTKKINATIGNKKWSPFYASNFINDTSSDFIFEGIWEQKDYYKENKITPKFYAKMTFGVEIPISDFYRTSDDGTLLIDSDPKFKKIKTDILNYIVGLSGKKCPKSGAIIEGFRDAPSIGQADNFIGTTTRLLITMPKEIGAILDTIIERATSKTPVNTDDTKK
jgi:hypothetical protein